MLCQKCKQRQANTHVKQVINGELTEMELCPECASKLGFDTGFADFLDIGSMMSSLLGAPLSTALAREDACPRCGSTFSQISKSGKVGCSACYDTFFDRLLPTIKRIHGNTVHTGKRLRTARLQSGETPAPAVEKTDENSIEELTKQLSNAIKTQEFELAAQLRDKINELKAQKGEEDNG